ncbi:MAG: LPS export ABC transporter periplasmic protein LptC [Marinicaulis sp.]|nr:LPS export ABC transporter periplasmic protein LptC [Marinicaulis sp.]NNL89908.1 LPS export ABC transporter periplasmic protein LptC [Marinicaulis sp.]
MTEGNASKSRLHALPNQARTTSAKALAHSRNIRRLRILLPLIAIGLVAAFFLNTQKAEPEDPILREARQMTATDDEWVTANPRFAGIDESGNPFEITARAATRNPAERDLVELEFPQAVQGENSETTVVKANRGLYRSDANMLELIDNVQLEHTIASGTYTFEAPNAIVSINDDVVTSDNGIGGAGPDGMAIKADRMKAYNAEGRVILQGNVSMRLFPKDKDDATKNEDSE